VEKEVEVRMHRIELSRAILNAEANMGCPTTFDPKRE
jgi:hypothetical protein